MPRALFIARFVPVAAACLLVACGGGGGGGGTVSASLTPTVSASSAGTPGYSQPLLITLTGTNRDQGIALSSAGCRNFTLSTAAPNVSSATTAYYTCTVTGQGAQTVTVQRNGDSATLATVAYSVPVPQVTLTFSNGAGVSGSLVVTLEPTKAPVTTDNFLAYVASGFYVGTVIHRNSPDFVLQGGGFAGPLTTTTTPTLKPTNAAIVLEDNAGLSNAKYTLSMARTSVADSATSQFFINMANNTFLDRTATQRGYAVFGTVTGGTAVVDAMAAAPCVAWPAVLDLSECLPVPNLAVTAATQTR